MPMPTSDARNTYPAFTPAFPQKKDWALPFILQARAATHGAQVFLDFPLTGEKWTYTETLRLTRRAASAVLLAGAAPGDRLLIMASNRPEFVFSWLAAAFAGMIEVPLSTQLRGSFFEHQVRTVSPSICAIEPEFASHFLDAKKDCASIRRFYVMGDGPATDAAIAALGAAGWSAERFAVLMELEALDGDQGAALPVVRVHDPAAIFFTSGTTGPAKGVIMSHAQMALFAQELVELTRLTDRDTYMACNPLFHGNAQFLAMYPALIVGARFVLREKYSATAWTSWIRDSKVTITNLMGVMFDFIWKQPPHPDDADNDLRCVFAIPTPGFGEQFKKRFGFDTFVEAYGMTEVSMPMMTPYGEKYPPGACGRLVDQWFDVRIVDSDTDEDVPDGEVGELLVRPKSMWTINSGYYGMPERTAEAYRNLWFHTGDGVRRDAEGWYYFVDRLKDTIRRRGEYVSSYELEQTVLDHPAVIECAAVAIKAEEGGDDEIVIFVVLRETASGVGEAEIRAWCQHRLPRFAMPRDVWLSGDLPKTPSGKIRKAELRVEAKQRYSNAMKGRVA